MVNEKVTDAKAVGTTTGAGTKSDGRHDADPATTRSDQEAADLMAKYGITRVPVDYFHYRGFRYTSLKDALAQAKISAPI